MNFRSEQLADAISASMPNQTLIDMLDEFEGTIPAEHVHFFECLAGEVRQRLSDLRESAIICGDVDSTPPDDAYQVEWEDSVNGGLRFKLTMVGDGNGPTLYDTEQAAVDAAWADYVNNL